jgi:hypothetical protein
MAAKEMILVIQAEGPQASLAVATVPMSAFEAVCLASRMWDSPTPARLEPATRERLDAYPSIPATAAVAEFLLNRPAVMRWSHSAKPGMN